MNKQYVKYSDCELCHGAGMIECSRCHGTKKDGHCHSCHGSGRKDKCKSCNGAGDVPCSACEGSGYDYDVEPPVKCKVCGGSGRQRCKSCSGTGKTKCKDCNGTGDEICHVCSGDGVIQCPKCEERANAEAEKKKRAKIKAAKEREERIAAEKRRVQRKADLFRGVWWLLFRVAAAGVYFACLKDCYRDIPDAAVVLLAGGFFVASYIIRPKFGGGVCYFLVGLALPIAALVCNSTNPMASFCLFTVMVTFFMRWMGEKLKFPFLTYPLVGAMVGFCTSPFAISHNVYNVTPWWFSVMGLSILFFFVNMGMSGNNGNGVVAKGARKTSWAGTFWILGICGIATWYIFASVKGEQYKFGWVPRVKSAPETVAEEQGAGTIEREEDLYAKGMDCLKRKEVDEAMKWLKMAAEKGDMRAMNELKKMSR